MKKHKNYGIYRELKQDMRTGLLEPDDYICVYKDENVVFSYEAYDERDLNELEKMAVRELMKFIAKNQ